MNINLNIINFLLNMPTINQLESLRVFKAVAECGNFTIASKSLNISIARVSKSIEHLENELETVLFNRTTRQMQITENGKVCYTRALELISHWDDLKEELSDSQKTPSGKLRISAPMTWGLYTLPPIINEFMTEYPNISLDIELSDLHVNVIEENFDLVLRLTDSLPDSNLICQKINSYKLIACASTAYLQKNGQPLNPQDLKHHDILMYSLPGASHKWRFVKDQNHIDVFLDPLLLSNNSKLLHSALVSGKGIALIPEFIIDSDINTGVLVQVLKGFKPKTLNLYSLKPSKRLLSNRLEIFHDFLYQRLSESAYS